jgi:serine/threonine protein phosphatase PrpC
MSTTPMHGGTIAAGRFRSTAATHPGARRTENQDAFLNRPDLGLWAVADGAGGHSRGAVAAQAVVAALDTIPAGLASAELLVQLRLRLDGVHAELVRQAAAIGEHVIMASTVVVLIARGEHFACLWAGDSRAYRLRGGTLEQLTRDHSLVQDLLDAGAIEAAEAEAHPQANVITHAVGDGSLELKLEKLVGALLCGDRFLLCSDGISKTLDPAGLAGLLAGAAGTEVAEQVVQAALQRGAADNITTIVVDVLG